MDEKLIKNLSDLISETLVEFEDLKKSGRFSAAEMEIKGPGEGIDGKPVNGSIAKDEDKDDEDEDESEEKKAEMKKAEEEVEKKKKEDEDKKKKEEIEKAEKDAMAQMKDEGKPGPDVKKSVAEVEDLKKSVAAQEALIKSYVDSKMDELSKKMEEIANSVKKLSDAPVSRKSFNSSDVIPLAKSNDGKDLSKSEVIDKLVELKKSGKPVDSIDVVSAERGGDLQAIAKKYNI